jgi:hypothetical protein
VSILSIVAPVFGLILVGWLATRTGYVGETTGRAVAEFAFKVALPLLLFRAMLETADLGAAPWRIAVAYFGAALLTWAVATLVSRRLLGRPPEDGAAVAMGSTFGNVLMLGVPLAISAFGPAATAPAVLIVSLDVPILWLLATLHVEAVRERDGQSRLAAIGAVGRDLARNPILLALATGLAGRLAGLNLPPLVDKATAQLAAAAIPSALFALGASLARLEIKGDRAPMAAIVAIKMLVFPAAVFLVSRYAMDLPPLWVAVATLLATMPVGANAFLFAQRYDRVVAPVAGAIAISTMLAVVVASLALMVLMPLAAAGPGP